MRRLLLLLLLGLSSTTAAASAIDGLWLTDDGKGVVRIGACGQDVCGWIARVLDRAPGVPTRDVRNPDPAIRGRPILGLPVLTGFADGGSRFAGGRAYDPKTGRSYRASMALNADGSLAVTGCVLVVCRSRRWTRWRQP